MLTLKKKLNIPGVYKITSPSGRVYVGSSKNIEKRFDSYRKGLAIGQVILNRSFVKYGLDAHVFEVIEECGVDKLFERERYHAEINNSIYEKGGLNLVIPSNGQKPPIYSASLIERLSKIKMGNKNRVGKCHSEESKKVISINRIGKNTGTENQWSKMVLNTESGIFYDTIKDAARAASINVNTFSQRLRTWYKFNYKTV